MKRIITLFAAIAVITLTAAAQDIVTGVSVSDVQVERHGDYMALDMTLDISNLNVKRNRAVLLTPCLINPDDSTHAASVGIYGRRRYYHYLRNHGQTMISGSDEISYRKCNAPSLIEYHEIVPFEEWMNGATFQLHRTLYGCCDKIIDQETGWLATYTHYVPELLYLAPTAEVKTYTVEGQAYIDFYVDKTFIAPEYHSNAVELGKVQESINTVKNDADATIVDIWLKGYASPESPYSHNTDLSIGRVNALKDYVCNLYNFDPSIITTENEPENWQGLRDYVEASALANKEGILALIDSDMADLDQKEALIKSTYPDDYKFLLQNCYPYLRKTEYKVTYTVRGYSDIDEIRQILATQPQKLSLNEIYLLAQTLEPGSDEFINVMETAVRLFPDDPIANLNAANVEMRRQEYDIAANYLERAGDSPEADYSRGVYYYMTNDYASAREWLGKAANEGISLAAELLEQINK